MRRKNEIDTTQPRAKHIDQMCFNYNVCRATIYKEIREGRLRVMKIRGRTVVTPEAEADWVRARETASIATTTETTTAE